jgi:myo-inositol-1(or 4)-monophosphatase
MKEIIITAAREAGKLLLDNFQTEIATKKLIQKTKFDYSIQMDKITEDKIISILRENDIRGKVVTEEQGLVDLGDSDYEFFIDPLDGTINYSNGVSLFCTSIGVKKGNEKIYGVIYYPDKDELFFAERGKGAFLNDKKIHVTNETEIENHTFEVAISWHPSNMTIKTLNRLIGKIRLRNLYCAGISMCFVAAGRSGGLIFFKSTPWDFMAGSLIVEEAGGIVTDINGNKWNENSGSIIAANPILHEKIMKLLNE